jgi:uncharacterized protein YqgC (DUF456 family)
MLKGLKRHLKVALGVVLIMFGVVSLIFPLSPGLVLITSGVLLISPSHGKKMIRFLRKILFQVGSKIPFIKKIAIQIFVKNKRKK